MRITKLNLLLFSLLFSCTIIAQEEIITVENPSFEGKPAISKLPKAWTDCAAKNSLNESPPDTQPGFWDVSLEPSHGSTYIGMVTRDVETHEAISTELSSTLLKDNCYSFKIDLAQSEKYTSPSQATDEVVQYTKPIVFRIYGSNEACEIKELLAESDEITNHEWEQFEFILKPKRSYKFLILHAFWKIPTVFAYNGHILLDNVQEIRLVKCEE